MSVSDNTFLVYDVEGSQATLDNALSNNFKYKEMCMRHMSITIVSSPRNFRAISVFVPNKPMSPAIYAPSCLHSRSHPVEQNYLSWFPNIGLNYQINDKDALNISAGRRIIVRITMCSILSTIASVSCP